MKEDIESKCNQLQNEYNEDRYTEIFKLKAMLDSPHIFSCIKINNHNNLVGKHFRKYQLRIPEIKGEDIVSIVCGDCHNNYKNLLEITGRVLTKEEKKQGSIIKCLTAEEVYKRIMDYWNNKKECGNVRGILGKECSEFFEDAWKNKHIFFFFVSEYYGNLMWNIDGQDPFFLEKICEDKNIAKGMAIREDLTIYPCYVVKQNDIYILGRTIEEAKRELKRVASFDGENGSEKIFHS